VAVAGFGLFGLLSHAVARCVPKFGIRMALGTTASRVVWGVIPDAFGLVVCGVALAAPLLMGAATCSIVHANADRRVLSLLGA
jgi:hypothetical protein